MSKPTRLYHLEAVNVKTGRPVRLTAYPMTHAEIQALKGRFTPHPRRYLRHAFAGFQTAATPG